MARQSKTAKKSRQPATLLEAIPEPSAKRTRQPSPLWLPDPQERWIQPPMPGKRVGERLWFESD